MITPVITRIDTTVLNRQLALASEFTRRSPAVACNTAGLAIAVEAKRGMPFVTPQTVDFELSVLSSPVIGKRGKPLKNKKTFSGGGVGKNIAIPLAVLIVQSRGKAGSNYNTLTGNRYALSGSPFKGVSRAAGAAYMRFLVDAMIKARHKSGHFLQQGWDAVIATLKPLADRRFSGLFGFTSNSKLGHATTAQAGNPVASCTIENAVGMDGQLPLSNPALMKYGTGPLQMAINREGEAAMKYYLSKEGKTLESKFNAMGRS